MVAFIMIRDPTFTGSVDPFSPAPEKSQFKEFRFLGGEKSAKIGAKSRQKKLDTQKNW